MNADLIRRLEAGEVGREIDAEIMFDFFAQPIKTDDKIKAYLWPEDDASWSFGLWCEPDRRERIKAARKGQETLLIERDNGLVLMNSLRVPNLTTSLDAAVALVERVRPGWYWDVSKVFPSGNMRAGLNPPPVQHGEHWLRDIGAIAFSSTPASALVAALLRSEG